MNTDSHTLPVQVYLITTPWPWRHVRLIGEYLIRLAIKHDCYRQIPHKEGTVTE